MAATTSDTDPRFSVGDAVVDTHADASDRGVAYVLDPAVGRADCVEVGTTGRTVASYDGNAQYPDAERVVRVAYHDTLTAAGFDVDTHDADALVDAIVDHCRDWGVSIRRYDYPEARLDDAPPATTTDATDATDPTP